jgi:hypothetical protein
MFVVAALNLVAVNVVCIAVFLFAEFRWRREHDFDG